MNSEESRIARMVMLGEEISKMDGQIKDIRYRDWLKYDSAHRCGQSFCKVLLRIKLYFSYVRSFLFL